MIDGQTTGAVGLHFVTDQAKLGGTLQEALDGHLKGP